jgi:putative membrane protein insertion efficiency factor
MKSLILAIIRAYQHNGTLWLPLFLQPQCKFHPTCSVYAHQAVEKYGIAQGISMALVRIIRCNPLSRGGVHLLS